MALGVHELNAIKWVHQRFGALGKVATLGRQGTGAYTSRSGQVYEAGYCESLLMNEFGATVVHSFDFSDYEGATHIFDLGRPLPIRSEYNLVIDGGTSEHVFNISQSLVNASNLVAASGVVVHFLPANSFCGHGMYQVSPEVFFSLYSKSNGFDTDVFIASYDGPNCFKYWYQVERPSKGERVELSSKDSIGVIVIARKTHSKSLEDVFQSDYTQAWSGKRLNEAEGQSSIKKSIKKFLIFFGLFDFAKGILSYYRACLKKYPYDFKSHQNLKRIDIKKLIKN